MKLIVTERWFEIIQKIIIILLTFKNKWFIKISSNSRILLDFNQILTNSFFNREIYLDTTESFNKKQFHLDKNTLKNSYRTGRKCNFLYARTRTTLNSTLEYRISIQTSAYFDMKMVCRSISQNYPNASMGIKQSQIAYRGN